MTNKTEELREALDAYNYYGELAKDHLATVVEAAEKLLAISEAYEAGYRLVPSEAYSKGNTGHGHVWKRPDGMRARCGGASMCADCAKDAAAMSTAPDKLGDILGGGDAT